MKIYFTLLLWYNHLDLRICFDSTTGVSLANQLMIAAWTSVCCVCFSVGGGLVGPVYVE